MIGTDAGPFLLAAFTALAIWKRWGGGVPMVAALTLVAATAIVASFGPQAIAEELAKAAFYFFAAGLTIRFAEVLRGLRSVERAR